MLFQERNNSSGKLFAKATLVKILAPVRDILGTLTLLVAGLSAYEESSL